ncbi:ABC transporter ATP-binding protein [Pseudophaeobacter sp.]|uniref:ABC transporter ATP-binding protein n=1 Tax=Pseudophaeobacter sp. TaxID=1971739 RepID=UPI00405A080C
MGAQEILLISLAMAILLLAQYLLCLYALKITFDATQKVCRQLRDTLFTHLKTLPLGFFQNRDSGDLGNLFSVDLEMIEAFLTDGLANAMQGLLIPLLVLCYLLYLNPMLAFAMILSLLAAVPVLLTINSILGKLAAQRQDLQADAASRIVEFAIGAKVMRAFGAKNLFQDKFDRALDDFCDVSLQLVARLGYPMALFTTVALIGVPMTYLGIALMWGSHEGRNLIVVVFLLFALYGPIRAVLAAAELFRLASASLDRLWDVWSTAPMSSPSSPSRPEGHEIEFKDVCFSYCENQTVLNGLSCRIPAGSMTAIVGASGSGKSTLLKLLSGAYQAQHGQITIGGFDLASIPSRDLADLMSIVPQDVRLFSGTISENISLSYREPNAANLREAADMAQATQFIEALPKGFDTSIGENGAGLSGGERQRLTIARAILKDSPIVILDEASSAIDPLNQQAFQRVFQTLRGKKTLVVVTHRLETIVDADQILVLESAPDGACIAERGCHATLLAQNGLYAHLFQQRTPATEWKITANEFGETHETM